MMPKFRAFVKSTKRLEDVVLIHLKSHIIKVASGKWYDFEEIVLMQSTGLHDKHGVEIFEGDVVNLNTTFRNPMTGHGSLTLDKNFEVVFERGAFCMKGHSSLDRKLDKLEVIGNVHQNQELLEDA